MKIISDTSGWWARTLRFGKGLAYVSAGAALVLMGLAFYFFALYETGNLYLPMLPAAVSAACGAILALNYLHLLTPRFTAAHGSARMGGRKDLEKDDLFKKSRDSIYCGMFHKTPVFYGGDQHVVTIGPTRSGKDTGLLVQNIMHLNRSVMVIDPKGELAAITARARAKMGKVIVVNPFGLLVSSHPHLKSHGFNPLAAPSFSENLLSNANAIAASMIPLTSSKEDHWPAGARELVSCLIMRAKFEQKDKACLGMVNEMLRCPFDSSDEAQVTLQKIMKNSAKHSDAELRRLANQFTQGSKEIDSIVSSARIPLSNLNNGTLLADLEKHPEVDGKPFDFEMLKHRIITVYIILPDDKLKQYSFWLRMVVANALDALKSTVPGENRPVLMLNEAGSLGHLEPLAEGMNMAAGKGVTIWTAWQSSEQIRQTYGPHSLSTFIGNAGVFNAFPPRNDLETGKYISESIGNCTEVVRSYSLTPSTKDYGKTDAQTGLLLKRPEDICGAKARTLWSKIEPCSVYFELEAPGYFDIKSMHSTDPNPYYRENAKQWPGSFSSSRRQSVSQKTT